MYTMYIFLGVENSDVEGGGGISTSSRERLDALGEIGGLGIVGRRKDRETSSSYLIQLMRGSRE